MTTPISHPGDQDPFDEDTQALVVCQATGCGYFYTNDAAAKYCLKHDPESPDAEAYGVDAATVYTIAETGETFTHAELRQMAFDRDASLSGHEADAGIAFDLAMGSLALDLGTRCPLCGGDEAPHNDAACRAEYEA